MIFSRSAVLACVVAASASVHAAPIHPLAEQDPTGLFNTNAPSNWSRGWEFQVNAPNVTVTELGLRTPIAGQPFELDLWDVATQTLLRSSTTTSGSTWKFVPITPITLTNGNNYIVSLFATGGQSYYWNNGLPSSWYPTGTIDYVRMKFHNSSTNVFPTHVLSGYQYGIPDIGYTQGTTPVPEPSTLALLGIGAMSILGYGIRKRKRTA